MKADLTMDFIKRLSIDSIPIGADAKGKLIFGPNPERKSYIVGDKSKSAPPGFGVRIAAKKTYVIRRKVNGKGIMPTVGNFTDFPDIASARDRAAEMALQMKATGTNPNADARLVAASEITLGQAFTNYRTHLTERARPAAANTFKVYDRADRKFKALGWNKRKVRDITPSEIKDLFIAGKGFPQANEQHFRWASTAVRYAIDTETLAAASAKRAATLTANPFTILTLDEMFRSSDQLEKEREENMVRNPLQPTQTLGPFLEAAWSKKNSNDNETGIHYLIFMLLWGCRTAEHNECVWGELLSEAERKKQSHVWLKETGDYGSYVFFHDTKNHRSHRLPLGTMAKELLTRRQVAAAKETINRGFSKNARKWVFPAKSKFSQSGHYESAQDLIHRVRDEIGLERLSRHDMRRSFGTMMTTLDVPDGIQRRFLNHANVSVTDTYTQAEWCFLREWMNRIEQAILSRAPNVYNSLKPADWPPLSAPDPHVCQPPKPRTGRPAKKKPDPLKTLEGESLAE